MRQIGNEVPVLLGETIGRELMSRLVALLIRDRRIG